MKKAVKRVGIGCLGFLLIGTVWFVVAFEVFSMGEVPGYQKSKTKVEYKYFSMASYTPQTREMPDADVGSFEIVYNRFHDNQEYGKDSDHVYVNGRVINGADPKTFEVIGKGIGRDKRGIYRGPTLISDDPENFRFDGSVSKDSKYVYSFRDTIHGADPATYKSIKMREGIGVDKDHVFCNKKLMPNSDPRSFRLISSKYWKDKTGVYDFYCNKLDIDQRTVRLLKKETNFLKDKDHIYINAQIIKEADRGTFRVLNSSYAKDRNNIFYTTKIILGADRRTFKIVDDNYAKDKNHIYYLDRKVVGADVETFKDTLVSTYSKNKKYWDKHGEIFRGERKKEKPSK